MSSHRQLQVLIIGAGTGGLCLAQGLLAAGVDVRVFERDSTPFDRQQGYRLTISATGNRALQSCLPKPNFDRFVAASAQPNTGVNFLDHRLHRLLSIPIPPAEPTAPETVRPISRITLRQILLDGLAQVVSFGKMLVSYENVSDGRVTAHFADGSTASADVLIGADGAGSHIRRQLLPQAHRIDTGVIAVSGRFALDDAARRETPRVIFQGPTLFMGPPGRFMFASAVEYAPGVPSPYDRDEYVMWGFSALRTVMPLPAPLETLSGETARSLVLEQMTGWHPSLRHLVERADASGMSCFPVKSAQIVGPWPTQNVTLLGDALHNMTPFRGMGANTALRDAAALRLALVEVDRGRRELLPALAAYEKEMVEYGFAAVRDSLDNMRRMHAESALSRFATRTMLRLADVLSPLQRLFRSER
ncbi:MAG TPA: NAD(P)/FAD-dependent oxidoreductase [Steroidobacteraceae bacterium]|jgi:2-polyprenyl-6-methoxyphenol hydroxylase-like FAD-dependent oxidoreductase